MNDSILRTRHAALLHRQNRFSHGLGNLDAIHRRQHNPRPGRPETGRSVQAVIGIGAFSDVDKQLAQVDEVALSLDGIVFDFGRYHHVREPV